MYVLVATAQTILWHGQLSLTRVIDDSKVTPFLSFCLDIQNHNNIVPLYKRMDAGLGSAQSTAIAAALSLKLLT